MFTDILWRFLILDTFLTGALSTKCTWTHLQEDYCNNENVLIVHLLNVKKHRNIYQMELDSLIKGDYSALKIADERTILVWTEMNIDHLAGYKFLILGRNKRGKIYTDECHGIIPWISLTKFQRIAVNHLYRKGCDCIPEIGHYSFAKHCKWYDSYMKKRDGKCYWVRQRWLSECEKRAYGADAPKIEYIR